VHNFGDPIPPEAIPVLFKPFRRALSAEHSGKSGWGLGLVMVQAIAEAHGGSVAVESTETGTIFTIDVLCDARKQRSS
jgi:signal transduction histidine kinase